MVPFARPFASALAPLLVATVSLTACGSDVEEQTLACKDAVLIAAVGDHKATSQLCSSPGSCIGGAELGSQPVLSSSNGNVLFVGRDTDVVLELDPSCGSPVELIDLDSLAPRDASGTKLVNANPHDAALAPNGTMVVAMYNVPTLAFVENGRIVGTRDLSEFDEDGNPQAEAVSVVAVRGAAKAFVALERLDDGKKMMPSTRPSQMLRIDVATRDVEAVIELEGRNPFNPMAEVDGALFLAEPGSFDSITDEHAGIERFDTTTSTSRLVVRERDLGASIVQLAVTKGCGAAIVAGPDPNRNPTSVVTFDPQSGEILASMAAPLVGPTDGYDLYGITWRGDRLYVGDRRRDGKSGFPVHVFDRGQGCTLTPSDATLFLDQAPIALRAAR